MELRAEENPMTQGSIPAQLPDWIRDHIRRYLASDGADGHLWDSSVVGGRGIVPTLLLTTTGRTSGKPLLIPLIYGVPTHPAWYLNLRAHPEVEVQVEAKKFRATARTASGKERSALWERMVAIYPPYTDYQARTQRQIPLVVLEPSPK
jgi:deazaflavin-dependent oxidoreductase (nitroreductase family)